MPISPFLQPDGAPPANVQRRIVCAAIYCVYRSQPVLICGPRHHDPTMRHSIAHLGPFRARPWTQGFVDQYGYFYDRQEAWKVAVAAGQIRKRYVGDTANGGTLFSENLY